MKTLLLTIATFFLSIYILNARQLTSVANEDFTSSSAWASGFTPRAGDTLIISSGNTVTIDSRISYSGSAMVIIVRGNLKIKSGGTQLSMPTSSFLDIKSGGILSTEGGGGGSSQTIKINGTTVWRKSDGAKTGPYMIDITGGYVPLPVQLLGFNLEQSTSGVNISWSTSNEINNHHYTIEKSINGGNFNLVAEVSASENATSINDYSFIDREINEENCIYRLSQTDVNGEVNYLLSKEIYFSNKDIQYNLYPNPSTDGVINISIPTITSSTIYKISIHNMSGENIYDNQLNAGDHKIDLNTGIAKGFYIISVMDNNGKTTFKKLVIK